MVITRVKNKSPDMIPTAFERKFDEKKDEIPPGICLICIKIFNIRNLRVDIKHKNGHKSSPMGSLMTRIWHAPSYYTPKGFFMPKGGQV